MLMVWTDFDDLCLKTRVSATAAFLWGLEQRYHNFRGGQNSPKPPKIGPNKHFPAKMPKSYNGNISKTVSPIKLKFEAQPGTTRC